MPVKYERIKKPENHEKTFDFEVPYRAKKNVFGNLTKVDLPTGKVIEYIVDGRNRRIGKKVDGVFTEGYIYSGQLAVIAKTDGNGVVTDKYVYGGVVKNGVTYRVITDYLGSPRVAVNSDTGDVVAAWDWDEYGNLISAKNEGFLPFGFAGGLRDRDTGLVRFGARDYDCDTGRWTAKDPIGFGGKQGNFYVYCGGEPINFFDDTGKSVVDNAATGMYIGNPELLIGDALSELDQITRFSRAYGCVLKCISGYYGLPISTGTLGASLNAWGEESITKTFQMKGKTRNATKGTSEASVFFRKVFKEAKFPFGIKLWAPTLSNMKIVSPKIATVGARLTPYVGAVIVLIDVAIIGYNTINCLGEVYSD